MPKEKIMGPGPTLEEAFAEIKQRNQHMNPEFVDLFIDVIYKMVIEILEEEEQANVQKDEKQNVSDSK